MKVVIVTNQTRTLVNFWSVLLRELNTAGHQTICLAPDRDLEAKAAVNALGAEVRHYELNRKGLNPLQELKALIDLYHELKKARDEGAEAVFVYSIKSVIYGLPAARLAGIPIRCAMITGLGYMFEANTPVKKALRAVASFLYRSSLRFAEAVLFQNEADVATFREHGCLPRKARVEMTRGTGVDTHRFAPSPLPEVPAPVFLLVGRLLEAKGLPEYAEAARIVKRQCPAARFLLLGPPEEGLGGIPLSLVRQWEAEELVEYLGETRDTRPFLAQCTVAVLPSWREGLPCSLMEAMSTGRAVVATNVPGCRDVVRPEETGLLCPVRNPQALAEACLRFVDDPTLAARMGAAGRRMVEEELDARKASFRILDTMHIPHSPCGATDDCHCVS